MVGWDSLGPDRSPSSGWSALAGATASRAGKTQHRVSWADAYDEMQYATDEGESAIADVTLHEHEHPDGKEAR